MKPHIVVTAAVIERDGAYLLTRRIEGTHLAGHWEFPGGKCDPGETLRACLEREIREELDAAVVVGRELLATTHDYPERSVELRFFACSLLSEPRAVLGQDMAWVPPDSFGAYPMPPADDELVRMLAARVPRG
jgi:mutator protein MutT